LIHLAPLGEWLEDIDLALVPRPRRRWEIRDKLAGAPPDQERQANATEWQDHVKDAFRQKYRLLV
jgi:hypothetical protein